MYIRRKLYSNIDGELVPVNETKLFAAKDDAKGAAAGAGIAAGTAGVGVAGVYGAGKLADKAAGKLQAKRVAAAQKDGIELVGPGKVEKALRNAGLDIKNAPNKVKDWLTNAEGKANAAVEGTVSKNGAKLGGAAAKAKTEKLMKEASKVARKRQLGAAGAALGVLGAGAAVGAGVKHLKDKKAEKQYSVLMTEEELKIFSEIVEDAGKGAGIAAGTLATAGAGAVGAKYGAGKIVRKMAQGRTLKAVEEKNAIMKEAAKKAADEKKKWAGKGKGVMTDRVKDAINTGKSKASQVKIADAGKIEKGMAALAKGGATATKWVKSNPKLAAGIAAGTIATGGAVGAGASVVKD